eukprot:5886468-Prorocentrum_lima.AAC.1
MPGKQGSCGEVTLEARARMEDAMAVGTPIGGVKPMQRMVKTMGEAAVPEEARLGTASARAELTLSLIHI